VAKTHHCPTKSSNPKKETFFEKISMIFGFISVLYLFFLHQYIIVYYVTSTQFSGGNAHINIISRVVICPPCPNHSGDTGVAYNLLKEMRAQLEWRRMQSGSRARYIFLPVKR